MAEHSKIEWTDASWTPIRARNLTTGKIGWHCEHATTGCEFCYAEGMNKRLGTGLPFKPGHRKDIGIFLDEHMLLAPLRWRRPRMVFVCSMTDLFASFVSDEWIDRIFAVMALCPQHRFQILTKRTERMREYCKTLGRHHEVDRVSLAMGRLHLETGFGANGATYTLGVDGWHFKNVWLGVSAERQQEADERIPHLLATPAAVRFVSAEPLLGPIDLNRIPFPREFVQCAGGRLPALDWVIVGGESGPNARPMHPQWARGLRDQCSAAGVTFFFKQWGEWSPHKPTPGCNLGDDVRAGRVRIAHPSGRSDVEVSKTTDGRSTEPGSRYMARVGKKAAGRLLDGREHNEFPRSSA